MKIKYYGTGAAEGVPGIFCDCEICQKSRILGGHNIRTRSQALVDDSLLIDFPPDTYFHVLNYGLDLKPITKCLITHSHSDHLHAPDFEMRRYGFAYMKPDGGVPPLDVYISNNSSAAILEEGKDYIEDGKTIRVFTVNPYEPFEFDGYKVTAMKADHARDLDPMIYIISKNGKTLLYANDTGYFPDETWAYLENTRSSFDYVSLDCTGMTLAKYRTNHMSLETNIEVRDRMLKTGCADDKTIFCCHHFSHNGGLTHDEFAPLAKEHGFLTSYDTMEVVF